MTIEIKAILIVVKGDDGIERVYRAREEWPIKFPTDSMAGEEVITSLHSALEHVRVGLYGEKTLSACFDEVKAEPYYTDEWGNLETFGAFTLDRLTGEER